MKTTDKTSALMLTALMVKYGIRKVFASPGSRNAPLLMSFKHCQEVDVEMVVDERCAAFMALGYAGISDETVALVCTSGTAMLNYLPAIAEAYHRQIPLLVITADRPYEWVGQKDSQTLVQARGLSPYVKKSFDIPDFPDHDVTKRWWCNRVINEALTACREAPDGPVHINMQFDVPLNNLSSGTDVCVTKIETVKPSGRLDTKVARDFGLWIASPHKVMIVLGNMPPSQKITKAIMKLSTLPNIAVLAENLANVHCDNVLAQIDAALCIAESREDNDRYKPDTVIYMGGSLVSGKLKQYLRRCNPQQMWYVGMEDSFIDTFQSLSLRIDMEPEVFLPQLASAMYSHRAESDYSALWSGILDEVQAYQRRYIEAAQWSSLKAISTVFSRIPDRWNVQLSNGMSVRLSQQVYAPHIHRWDCNRGVSGIDGSTSTAVGAQLAYRHGVTLLITGDMSLAYDLTALGVKQVTNRMRVIVLENGGGNIFRCVPSTQSLPILEECLELDLNSPFTSLASAWGWKCMEADDETSLNSALETFVSESDSPCMLVIKSDGKTDAATWEGYFKYINDSISNTK